MPKFAILLVLLFPCFAYAAGTVRQTPPTGHAGPESGSNSLTEHRHNKSQDGDSAGPAQGGEPAGGPGQPSNSLAEHRHKQTPDGDSSKPTPNAGTPDNSPTAGTDSTPDESNPRSDSNKPPSGPAI